MADDRIPSIGSEWHTWRSWLAANPRDFRQKLADLDLNDERIESQDVSELQYSLAQLDQLLASLEAARHSDEVPASERANARYGSAIALEQKNKALRRLLALSREQDRAALEKTVNAAVPDQGSAADLLQQLMERVNQQVEDEVPLQSQILETQKAQQDMAQAAARFKAELSERKSAMYRTWIEREFIASIVGSVLLLGFATILVVAMFMDKAPTEIITSAFLLVLGYFFGQRTSNSKRSTDSDSSSG